MSDRHPSPSAPDSRRPIRSASSGGSPNSDWEAPGAARAHLQLRVLRSPLDSIAWMRILIVIGTCVLAWISHRLLGGHHLLAVWVTALFCGAAWLHAVRFLLLDTKGRRFWLLWLGVAFLLVLVLSPDSLGRYVALTMAGIFLLLRRYQPYRHLSGQRRALVFFLGVGALLLLSIGWEFALPPEGGGSWFRGVGHNLVHFFLGAMRIFWLLSLVNLFVRMRLNSFRLKAKLAVSTLFLALVPLILILVLGTLAIFGALGGSRAASGREILLDWGRQLAHGAALTPVPFARSFAVGGDGPTGAGGEHPAWVDALQAIWNAVPAAAPDSASETETVTFWTPADTTAYFLIDQEVWLLRVEGTGTAALRIQGYPLDKALLDHLSNLLRCDVGLYGSSSLMREEEDRRLRVSVNRPTPTTTASPTPVGDSLLAGTPGTDSRGADPGGTDPRAAAAAADSTDAATASLQLQGQLWRTSAAEQSASLWQRPLRFGADFLPTFHLRQGGITSARVLLHLQVRLADLAREFLHGEYEINQVITALLIALGVLFLALEGFALFLGLRITAGITTAVRALRRGTLRLASGDLTTRIDLPNEDEFGDLADSFNDMTVAVKRGREEAVARERLERELATARLIQDQLLPHEIPVLPGFDVAGTSVPSRHVGGDYFDFLLEGEDRLGVAIADVSGKGIPAALLMSNLQASLHGQVIHPSTVAEVVGRVNNLLVRSTSEQMFATFFYGVLDRQGASLTCTNAGHNPPILRRADGTLEFLERGGLLLGMMSNLDYEEETIVLQPGDLVVLFTDGITEAEGPLPVDDAAAEEAHENMFGDERLQAIVQAHAHRSAAEIKDAILEEVESHAAGVAQSDDITLVVIKRLG